MTVPTPQQASRKTSDLAEKTAMAVAQLFNSAAMAAETSNKADGMLIMTMGLVSGINLLAAILGRCPEGKDKENPANYVNEVSMLTAAIFAAKVGSEHDEQGTIRAEFSPMAMIDALDAVEKIIGKRPDDQLDSEMVRQTRELMMGGPDMLKAFLDKRNSPVMPRSILDYNVVQPGHEAAGAEPSLRMLIHKYYAAHFDDVKASAYAKEYIDQLHAILPYSIVKD